MIVRDARLTDIPSILAIYNDMIIHTTAVYDEEPHSLAQRTQWFNDRQAQGFPVLVAELDQEILGFASYGTFRPWQGFKHTVEHAVYVSNQAQGKGIGRALMLSLIERAQQQGIHVMVAGIDASNEASIQLHEKLGFTTSGILHEVGRKFDRWLDLQFMTKRL